MRSYEAPYALPAWRSTHEVALSPATAAVVAAFSGGTAFGPLHIFGPTHDQAGLEPGSLAAVATPDEICALLHHVDPLVRVYAARALRRRCPERADALLCLVCDASSVRHVSGGCIQDELIPVWQHALMAILWSPGPAAAALAERLASSGVLHLSLVIKAHWAQDRWPTSAVHHIDVMSSIAGALRQAPSLERFLEEAFEAPDPSQVPELREIAQHGAYPHSSVAAAALLAHDALSLEDKVLVDRQSVGSVELESRLSDLRRRASPAYPRVFAAVQALVAGDARFARMQRTLDWCARYEPRRS